MQLDVTNPTITYEPFKNRQPVLGGQHYRAITFSQPIVSNHSYGPAQTASIPLLLIFHTEIFLPHFL